LTSHRNEVELTIKEFPNQESLSENIPLAKIHLLYRPGHYDLLYPLSNSDFTLPLSTIPHPLPSSGGGNHHSCTLSPSPSPSLTATPILSRTISVGCIYHQLQLHHGLLPLQETLYEVIEADFLVIDTTHTTHHRLSSSPVVIPPPLPPSLSSPHSSSLDLPSHPFLQLETFTIHKYSDETVGAPSLLEQTINHSRQSFKIPPSRTIKILPAIDFSLDYLFQDYWFPGGGTGATAAEFRDRIQMVAVIDQISFCQISILGVKKFENNYQPITKFNEINSSLELSVVIDWSLFHGPSLGASHTSPPQEATISSTPEAVAAAEEEEGTKKFLNLLTQSTLKLNQMKYSFSMKSPPTQQQHSQSPSSLSCELLIFISVEVIGTNEPQHTLSIPFSSFGSIGEFFSIIRQEFHLKPQCCLQICVPANADRDDAARRSSGTMPLSSTALWDAEEIFHYCLKSGPEIPLLYLKLCEVPEEGIACETISGATAGHGTTEELICRLSGCGHYVCQLCLLRHLVLYSNDRKLFSLPSLFPSLLLSSTSPPHSLLIPFSFS
jgi:hypothetical protein